jgi:hypothetical protein
VGARTGLDGCRKYRPPPGFDPRTIQPVASRYTDCAIATHERHDVLTPNFGIRWTGVINFTTQTLRSHRISTGSQRIWFISFNFSQSLVLTESLELATSNDYITSSTIKQPSHKSDGSAHLYTSYMTQNQCLNSRYK